MFLWNRIRDLTMQQPTTDTTPSTAPPTSNLPPEILLEVFHQLVDVRDHIAAVQVCRLWRSFLLETTTLRALRYIPYQDFDRKLGFGTGIGKSVALHSIFDYGALKCRVFDGKIVKWSIPRATPIPNPGDRPQKVPHCVIPQGSPILDEPLFAPEHIHDIVLDYEMDEEQLDKLALGYESALCMLEVDAEKGASIPIRISMGMLHYDVLQWDEHKYLVLDGKINTVITIREFAERLVERTEEKLKGRGYDAAMEHNVEISCDMNQMARFMFSVDVFHPDGKLVRDANGMPAFNRP
ncbi:hypothetical protein H072_5946 [Dactylellina haptotyla CBS 200.50]|uniref:F-box domain-containing protein n=1 Tax=Dactylellina haptotyla (strain CBS 200.50) TaxID=1284197 RepID=S8ABG4_DACHA|nr:hypothetical protein H072_5946 [Dactylellina haptotyla CBS 200.50]